MERSITWIQKLSARLLTPRLPLQFRFNNLFIACIILGIIFVAFSSPAFAQTPLNYTPIPKANIVNASTQGAPIEQHAEANLTSITSYLISTNISLNADLIFQKINTIREQYGLPDFQTDSRLCTLATSRAPEVPNEIATNTMHAGMYARNLPYWNTENIIDINSEDAAVNWWMNDYIHRISILGYYTYSCVACSGTACAEEFSNFEEK